MSRWDALVRTVVLLPWPQPPRIHVLISEWWEAVAAVAAGAVMAAVVLQRCSMAKRPLGLGGAARRVLLTRVAVCPCARVCATSHFAAYATYTPVASCTAT